jgi:SEC-C motif domain protein
MNICPCGSGRELDECCGPILAGAPAASAEALMRSRYTAFVRRDFAHIERTQTAEADRDFDRVDAEHAAADVDWLELDVRHAREEGDSATVEFLARFRRQGHEAAHYEVSSFRRVDGRWLYSGGKNTPDVPQRFVEKIGRNDPCPCGSGKKFKKCCGA